MFDDKYVDQPHGIPVVSFYSDYHFQDYIPPSLIKTPDGNSLIFTHQHCHSDFEILYIASGTAEFSINDEKFTLCCGDILLTSPYDIHYGTTSVNQDSFSYYCIDFDIDFLTGDESNIFAWSNSQKIHNLKFKKHIPANEAEPIVKYIVNLHDAYTSTFDGWKLEVKGNLFLIFSYLIKNRFYHEENNAGNDFMKCVFNYIEENYTKPITSKDAADYLTYNHSYFCRYFKKNFSCTFSEFLNVYRIKQATSMIENGETKVSKLTTDVGFNNFSYFSNTFKKYHGVLPSAYIARLAQAAKKKE